jgi:hypothetical protein
VHIRTKRGDAKELFGHLWLLVPGPAEDAQASDYTFRIEEVSDADPREVIRALAEAASCGDHCCGH